MAVPFRFGFLGLVLATLTLTACDTAEPSGGSVIGAWSLDGLPADTYWFVNAENLRVYRYSADDACWLQPLPPFFVEEVNGERIYRYEISNVSVRYALSLEGEVLRADATGTTTGTHFGTRVEDTLATC